MKLEENEAVLCTVKRIDGTTVFLEIEGNGLGTMIFSEVSAGRIRNIRDFIVINKKIVCKVLRIRGENIELSLRRVTGKEREEVLDDHKKEKNLQSMLKPVLKDKSMEVFDKIKAEYYIPDFLEEAKEKPKILEKFMSKAEAQQMEKIFTEKKEKEKEVKKMITLVSLSDSGIKDIKSILGTKDAEIRYLGSSKFAISVKAKDFKLANQRLEQVLKGIEEKAKALKAKIQIR